MYVFSVRSKGFIEIARCGKKYTKNAFARQKCMLPFYCVELFWEACVYRFYISQHCLHLDRVMGLDLTNGL